MSFVGTFSCAAMQEQLTKTIGLESGAELKGVGTESQPTFQPFNVDGPLEFTVGTSTGLAISLCEEKKEEIKINGIRKYFVIFLVNLCC